MGKICNLDYLNLPVGVIITIKDESNKFIASHYVKDVNMIDGRFVKLKDDYHEHVKTMINMLTGIDSKESNSDDETDDEIKVDTDFYKN